MPKAATSLHYVTYLQMYLIEFAELQYSTFQCVLNDFESSVEDEAIQLLSTTKLFPFTFVVIVRPLSLGDRRLYSG